MYDIQMMKGMVVLHNLISGVCVTLGQAGSGKGKVQSEAQVDAFCENTCQPYVVSILVMWAG